MDKKEEIIRANMIGLDGYWLVDSVARGLI